MLTCFFETDTFVQLSVWLVLMVFAKRVRLADIILLARKLLPYPMPSEYSLLTR